MKPLTKEGLFISDSRKALQRLLLINWKLYICPKESVIHHLPGNYISRIDFPFRAEAKIVALPGYFPTLRLLISQSSALLFPVFLFS